MAQGIIIAAVAVTGVTTLVAQAEGSEGITFRPFLGCLILGAFLTFIDMLSEQLAKNFAMLIILIAFLRNGQKTFGYVTSATTGTGTTTTKKKAATSS